MIDFLKPSNTGFKPLSKPEKGCWINVEAPTREELEELNKIIRIPEEEVLSAIKDVDELPRIEKLENDEFIIIRVPKKVGDLVYLTVPMGIMLTKNYLITICYYQTDLISVLKKKKFVAKSKHQVVLNLLLSLAKLYIKFLREIDRKTYLLEEELIKSVRNESLVKLMGLEKALVYFMTSIKSIGVMLRKLGRFRVFTRFEKERELLEDVIIEFDEALELVNIHSNVLGNTMDAFASIISNNQNRVMKFLTSITIILMIPTLIASIYGMNIRLPIQYHPQAFLITMLVSIIFSFIGAVLFWRRDLF
ncbi:MAG: magnesium transporter CorA family protein [Nanoarchaeota archaeon]|nr:magnesium transporter CorA family protein [Nanoarchaeota archaeon]